MTEGIIGAMKALEIVVVFNNSSTEGMICADVMAKERDEAVAKKEKLDKELANVKAKLGMIMGSRDDDNAPTYTAM